MENELCPRPDCNGRVHTTGATGVGAVGENGKLPPISTENGTCERCGARVQRSFTLKNKWRLDERCPDCGEVVAVLTKGPDRETGACPYNHALTRGRSTAWRWKKPPACVPKTSPAGFRHRMYVSPVESRRVFDALAAGIRGGGSSRRRSPRARSPFWRDRSLCLDLMPANSYAVQIRCSCSPSLCADGILAALEAVRRAREGRRD